MRCVRFCSQQSFFFTSTLCFRGISVKRHELPVVRISSHLRKARLVSSHGLFLVSLSSLFVLSAIGNFRSTPWIRLRPYSRLTSRNTVRSRSILTLSHQHSASLVPISRPGTHVRLILVCHCHAIGYCCLTSRNPCPPHSRLALSHQSDFLTLRLGTRFATILFHDHGLCFHRRGPHHRHLALVQCPNLAIFSSRSRRSKRTPLVSHFPAATPNSMTLYHMIHITLGAGNMFFALRWTLSA